MSNRPLEATTTKQIYGSQSPNVLRPIFGKRSFWKKSTAVSRKFVTFGVIICSLIIFLVWCGATATSRADLNYTGKSTTKRFPNYEIDSTTTQPLLPRGIAFLTAPLFWQRLRQLAGVSTSTSESVATGTNAASHLSQNVNSNIINESLIICSELYSDSRVYIQNRPRQDYANLPTIYFVTPTYPRREQVAELTRLAYTLLHVPRLHWLLANDYSSCNVFLDYTLNKFGIPYTHLVSPIPERFRKKKPLPRGVSARRAAVQWLRHRNITKGVLYFGDDDNTYDLKLFAEIRDTQRVSMFPVGLIDSYSVSGPVVRGGKVVGFLDSWVADRHWPVDMAGFAVSLPYLIEHPLANMPYKPGYEEDYFLRSLGLRLDYIEPKGSNCTEILVWHTQTKNHNRTTVRIAREYLDERSNLGALFKSLEIMGVAAASDNEGFRAIISKNGKEKPIGQFLS